MLSRLQVLAATPRRTVGALALVLAAAGVAVGSGANFTAQKANPSNTFATGSLSIDDSKSGAAILTASNLKPGDTITPGIVDIANSGTVSGRFSLSTSNVADASGLLGQLDLVVKDCGLWVGATPPSCAGAPSVYTGKIQPFATVSLGTYAAGDKHRFEFDGSVPSGLSDTYQGVSASVELDWNAVTP
jgi:spore coat-associated protein N